jgi:hypothetical protein
MPSVPIPIITAVTAHSSSMKCQPRSARLMARSRARSIEQFGDDSLFCVGLCGPGATPTCRPTGEVERGRAAVVRDARVGTRAEQRLDGGRASVSHRSMKRRHPASCSCVGVCTRHDQEENDRPLLRRVPRGRAGNADHRRVERFGAPTVSRADVRTADDQLPCHLGVVAERRAMERRVTFVDLCQSLGQEELVASRHASCRQRRGRVDKTYRSSMITGGDRREQSGDVAHAHHIARCGRGGMTRPLSLLRTRDQGSRRRTIDDVAPGRNACPARSTSLSHSSDPASVALPASI